MDGFSGEIEQREACALARSLVGELSLAEVELLAKHPSVFAEAIREELLIRTVPLFAASQLQLHLPSS